LLRATGLPQDFRSIFKIERISERRIDLLKRTEAFDIGAMAVGGGGAGRLVEIPSQNVDGYPD
jgi:hypothetical protein